MRRIAIASLLTVSCWFLPAAPAVAAEPSVVAEPAVESEPAVAIEPYEQAVALTFPVAGPVRYIDDYHARRSGGRIHRATDVMAAEGQRVHAAMGGTITWITGLTSPVPSYGYLISIAGDDGRRYSYIHLGRQTGGPSRAYAPGMARGVRVERGQWIGYNGCSGNASCQAPHLHFEIEDLKVTDPYDTHRRNPYRSLRHAQARGDLPRTLAGWGPIALAGDWDGDGVATPGWFQDGAFRLRNDHGSGPAQIRFQLGRRGDVPVVGDWDGDGRDSVGVVRGRRWYLTNRLHGGSADVAFYYGGPGDLPVAGDWDGDGRASAGVVRGRVWHLRNGLRPGPADFSFGYGRAADQPVVGDWDGNRSDTPGVVRRGVWHVRNNLERGPATVSFRYGHGTDAVVAGDWNGDRRASPGVVRSRTWYLRNKLADGAADLVYAY